MSTPSRTRAARQVRQMTRLGFTLRESDPKRDIMPGYHHWEHPLGGRITLEPNSIHTDEQIVTCVIASAVTNSLENAGDRIVAALRDGKAAVEDALR